MLLNVRVSSSVSEDGGDVVYDVVIADLTDLTDLTGLTDLTDLTDLSGYVKIVDKLYVVKNRC